MAKTWRRAIKKYGSLGAISFERSGGGNCEAISDGAVASSKVFDVHLDFAYSSDYSSFQRGHVTSNKNYNNLHVFSFDITSPKIVIIQLSLYFSRFFFLAYQKPSSRLLLPIRKESHRKHVTCFCP
jgi:hypothetical protein